MECSWWRFLRKKSASTLTSYDRRPRRREQRPNLHFCCPGSFIRIAAPAFRLMRFLVPLLYCLHCSLFLAVRLLAVVLGSLLGWSNFTAVGSKVRVRRPLRFWAASLTWDVAPSEDRQYWVSFVFLCFQEQSFAGLHSIFHFSIRLAHRDIDR